MTPIAAHRQLRRYRCANYPNLDDPTRRPVTRSALRTACRRRIDGSIAGPLRRPATRQPCVDTPRFPDYRRVGIASGPGGGDRQTGASMREEWGDTPRLAVSGGWGSAILGERKMNTARTRGDLMTESTGGRRPGDADLDLGGRPRRSVPPEARWHDSSARPPRPPPPRRLTHLSSQYPDEAVLPPGRAASSTSGRPQQIAGQISGKRKKPDARSGSDGQIFYDPTSPGAHPWHLLPSPPPRPPPSRPSTPPPPPSTTSPATTPSTRHPAGSAAAPATRW